MVCQQTSFSILLQISYAPPVPHEHSFRYPGLIARNPETHGASCELV